MLIPSFIEIMSSRRESENYTFVVENKKEDCLKNTFDRIFKVFKELASSSAVRDMSLKMQTKTNAPLIHVDARFQPAITVAANAYLKKFCFRFDECAKTYIGTEEYKIVRNRVENLVTEGLANRTIVSPDDVKKVIDHNLMFQPAEDRAIIDAYKSGSKLAEKYVFIFFSAKVVGMMSTSDLLHKENAQDIFFGLQTAIFTAIDKFNPKRSGFGMPKKYTDQMLMDEWRSILAKEIYPIVCNRHQIADKNKLERALTDDDLRRMSVEDIAAKCKVSKNVVQLYIYMNGMTSLDGVLPSGDNETQATVGDLVASEKDNYALVEDKECIKTMFAELEKEGISVELWKQVLTRTLSAFGASNSYSLSERICLKISKELHIPKSVIATIFDKFKGLSQNTAAAIIYQISAESAVA